VSSARQKKDETIGSQLVAFREYAAAVGWSVPEQWVFTDDGHSGARLARRRWRGCVTWSLNTAPGSAWRW
jgi:hypothetical protein